MDYTDPVQHPITAGYGLEDLDRDLYNLSDLSVRRVKGFTPPLTPRIGLCVRCLACAK